jgi:hypothetical protein
LDRRSILIVDTGPIWELVLYRAVNELGFLGLKRNLTYFDSVEAYENCGSFLSSFGRKTTSASVVAELYHQIRDTESGGHLHLWKQVYEEFENMGMEENVVKLLDMDPDLVTKYGPTDVSLLEIARRNVNQKPVILTLDTKLRSECVKAQIRSDLLIEVCNSRL